MARIQPLLAVLGALSLAACQTTNSKQIYQTAFDHGSGKETVSPAPDDKDTIQKYQYTDLSPGERPDIQSEEAGLWMMMDRAEQDLATSGNRIMDPALNAYANKVVCKIAGDYCSDFRVYVMRVPAFNASMAPNGTMLIYSGLLLRTKNEAQLSAVIGHEMAHYLRRHSAQRMKDAVDKTGALAFIQLAGIAAGVAPVGNLATLAVVGSMQSFSRDHEREADGYGLALMVRAGYDPAEAQKIWARVIRERDVDPDKQTRDAFLSTHPASEERSEVLKELASSVTDADALRTGENAYQNAIAPLRNSFLHDEIAGRKFETTNELLNMLLEDGHAPAEVYFFRGELYRHRNKEGDTDLAIEAYDKAIAEGSPPPELYKSLGLILQRAKKQPEAKRAFSTYLSLAPHAPDAQLIRSMIEGSI